jgi:DNA-binding NarL/FixJ family response regulator
MDHRIKLLIVARNAPHRQVMRAWLAGAADITIVGETQGEPEALTLTGKRQPDVVLLGVGTLGLDDLQAVTRLRARYPHSKVIVLSHSDDQEHLALEVLREGAWGYLAGGRSWPPELVEAIRTVARGGSILSPGMAGRILDELSQSC